ncbi:MAG: urease accessory UreF family protein [Cyanobacteria bacterium J06636_16]
MDVDQRFALMQLSDQFFPSGSFTLSHGLETLVQNKQIQSADELHTFLRLFLHNRVGSSDLVALSQAYRASSKGDILEICSIDLKLYAQTPLQVVRDTQHKSGRALLMVASSIWQTPQLNAIDAHIRTGQMQGSHPTIFGATGQAAGLSEDDTLFAFLHGFLAGLCGVGIRLGILGHIKAQLILKEMATDLETVAGQAKTISLEEIWSSTPFIDIAQMTHRHLPQKLFIN